MDKIILWTSCFLVLLATGLCQDVALDEPCQTHVYNGTCVIVHSCSSAISLLKLNDVKTLRNMFCGFEGRNPKVCCPIAGSTIIFNNNTEETATNRPKKTTTAKSEEQDITTVVPVIPSDKLPDKKTCGQVKNSDRIYGGTVAEIDEFPWIARMKYIDPIKGDFYACAASLITDRFLVTAAHCITKQTILVRLGEWDEQTEKDCVENDCNNKPVDIMVRKIFIYPKYSKQNKTKHDIALLKLEEPVTFTDFIQPICLPTTEYIKKQDYVTHSSYWTAGWGTTEFGEVSHIKRKVKLEAVSTELCEKILPTIPQSSFPNLICAGGRKGEDSCRGDSGGPLVREVMENDQRNWYLFGITSLGTSRCGTEGIPGLYTRVSPYISWIKDIISNS